MITPFPQRSLEPLRSQGAAPIELSNLNSVNILSTVVGITTKSHDHETLYACMHMLTVIQYYSSGNLLPTVRMATTGYRKCLPQKHGKQIWLQLLSCKALSTVQGQ